MPAETLGTSALAKATSERVYIADVLIANVADGRLCVFEARAGKLLGMVNTGFGANFALGPVRRAVRRARGARARHRAVMNRTSSRARRGCGHQRIGLPLPSVLKLCDWNARKNASHRLPAAFDVPG